MIVETYSVVQPHREAILIWIAASALLGSALITYRFRWKGLPAILAFVILSPSLIVLAFNWLTYEQGAGSALELEDVFALSFLALPFALLGVILALGVRFLIGRRETKDG